MLFTTYLFGANLLKHLWSCQFVGLLVCLQLAPCSEASVEEKNHPTGRKVTIENRKL